MFIDIHVTNHQTSPSISNSLDLRIQASAISHQGRLILTI